MYAIRSYYEQADAGGAPGDAGVVGLAGRLQVEAEGLADLAALAGDLAGGEQVEGFGGEFAHLLRLGGGALGGRLRLSRGGGLLVRGEEGTAGQDRITSYNVCYTKLLRDSNLLKTTTS